MTLRTERLAQIVGANGGVAYIEATWDDVFLQDDDTMLDPTADMIIRTVIYQNLTEKTRHADIGGKLYDIAAGTQRTVRNLNPQQRSRIDAVPYIYLY